VEAYLNLGNVWVEQGQYEKGSDAIRQSLQLAPDSLAPYENLVNSRWLAAHLCS
jgi:Arc/MetJ-type ribon-helix-helix transcriptional regulator